MRSGLWSRGRGFLIASALDVGVGDLGERDGVVVLGDDDQASPAAIAVSIGGFRWRRPSPARRPDGRGALVGEEGFAEGPADEVRLLDEVDLVAAEVQQLGVDDGEARLAAGLGGDAGDEVADGHQLDLRPPTIRATSRFSGSAHLGRCGRAPRGGPGLLVSARIVLITRESASSPSGGRTMIERASWGLTISRSSTSIGSAGPADDARGPRSCRPCRGSRPPSRPCPSRPGSRRRRSCGSRWRRRARRLIEKTSGDQPRITVWPLSTTNERPLRSSSSLSSMPVKMTPIRVLKTRIPPAVIASMEIRKGQLP